LYFYATPLIFKNVDEKEREEYIQLQSVVRKALADTENRILRYPTNASDRDFRFLISKAVSYREVLAKIARLLSDENEPL